MSAFDEIKAKKLKQVASMEKASAAIGVVTAQASEAVDEFFAEKAIKDAEYVPQKLVVKQLPVGLYKVQWETGVGIVPQVLSGTYTTIAHAEKAINNYMTFRDATAKAA